MIDEIRIIDRVYADPDSVREDALAQPFESQGNFPGYRTAPASAAHRELLKTTLAAWLTQTITHWPQKENTCYQLCLEGNQTWVHHDSSEWAGVLFLTPDDVARRAEEKHGQHGKQFIASHIADRGEFWWNERKPDERVLWESKIHLSEPFFNEIIQHPVPLDMNTLTALKRSTLGLDLYLWLVYRTFTLRAPLRLSWRQVYRQFGVHPAKASDKRTVDAFRTKVLRELKKIKMAWPGLNYATAKGVLILSPSTPLISPKHLKRRE